MRLPIKSPPIFYGWWIVGACFLIALYTIGVVFYGFTAVFEPLVHEFGWSYAQVSLASSIRGLEAGLLAPVVGMLIDRWGPRKLIFGGVVFTGLGLIIFSQMTSLAMFYLASVLMAIGLSSSGVSVMMTAVTHWFRKKAGLAIGIMVSGYGASGLIVPVVVGLVDTYEWRTAMLVLALGVFIVGLPLSLVIRHKPEQYGYFPDGIKPDTSRHDAGAPAVTAGAESSTGLRKAMRSRVFWFIVLALVPQFIVVTAVVTHVMPYLSSLDIPRSTSGLVATAIPLLSIGGRFGFGWLTDRFDASKLMVVALIMLALGLVCFEFVATGWTWLLVPSLTLFGIGYGGNITLLGILVVRYFGRGNFGAILGWIWGILLVGNVAGPPVAGWVFDNYGSYQWVWLSFAALVVVGAVIMANIPKYRERKTV